METYYINKMAQGEYLNIAEIWEAVEEAKELMGVDALLDALTLAMGRDELESKLLYVIRSNDLADAEEEEEEEEEETEC